jgi:hypothetical protein
MGATHFLTKLPRVSMEMSFHVLAYNFKRVMQIVATGCSPWEILGSKLDADWVVLSTGTVNLPLGSMTKSDDAVKMATDNRGW